MRPGKIIPNLRLLTMMILAALLVSCGDGYAVPSACLNIADLAEGEFPRLLASVHDTLASQGFEDLGTDNKTIALLRQGHPGHSKSEESAARLFERRHTFLNSARHLRVVVTDFTNGIPEDLNFSYKPTSTRFAEIQIFDERPGGFGPDGLDLYGHFLSSLRERYGATLQVVLEPPPTDDAAYRRVTIKNDILAGIDWLIAFILPFLITAPLTRFVLQKFSAGKTIKRVIFVIFNTWLVTPLPFPAASILVIPLPNLCAFPWITADDYDYYSQIAPFAAISLPVVFGLCALVSLFLFREKTQIANTAV